MTLKMIAALAAMTALAGCVDEQTSQSDLQARGTLQNTIGADPGTADMSMCSDGAMREDCSFAPNGY